MHSNSGIAPCHEHATSRYDKTPDPALLAGLASEIETCSPTELHGRYIIALRIALCQVVHAIIPFNPTSRDAKPGVKLPLLALSLPRRAHKTTSPSFPGEASSQRSWRCHVQKHRGLLCVRLPRSFGYGHRGVRSKLCNTHSLGKLFLCQFLTSTRSPNKIC